MRRLFLATGVLLFAGTVFCLWRFAAGESIALGWSVLSAGLALAGGLCYLSAASVGSEASPDAGADRPKPRRRIGVSLLTAMIIVAMAAVLLAWAATERRKQIDALTPEYRRLEDRVRWAEKMHENNYISDAQLAADQDAFETVKSKLESLSGLPRSR